MTAARPQADSALARRARSLWLARARARAVDERKVHLTRILRYLADHAIAVTALVFSLLALAGGSYAAFSISGSQIQNRTINPVKFNPRLINGNVRGWAVVAATGRVVSSAGHPVVSVGTAPGQYTIDWGSDVNRRCATDVTVDEISSTPAVAGYSSGATFAFTNHRTRRRAGRTLIETFNQSGKPAPLGFDVAVIC